MNWQGRGAASPFTLHLRRRNLIISSLPSRPLRFTDKQVQKKFKHASVLGVEGNYTKENAQKFMTAVEAYISDSDVQQIVGTYRGDPVIHYYHAERKINAITKRDGLFVSVWSVDDEQIENLEQRGSL